MALGAGPLDAVQHNDGGISRRTLACCDMTLRSLYTPTFHAAQKNDRQTTSYGASSAPGTYYTVYDEIQESLALASMARDDPPASSTASSTAPARARRPKCAVKWDRNLKPKLAIMRQCTSVTDRRTDGLASWHKREMYILYLALKRFDLKNRRTRWANTTAR